MKVHATKTQQVHRLPAGFSLLEVMLAVALMAILIGGVFGVQRGAMTVAKNVMESQEENMRISSFAELVRRSFEQAPGNSKVHLVVPRSNNGGSEIYFKDHPHAFAWSGVTGGSKAVILRVEASKIKSFNAVVLYLDAEAAKDYENGSFDEKAVDRATGLPRVRRLELMEGIQEMTWKVIDDTATAGGSQPGRGSGRQSEEDWLPDWPLDKTKRPTRLKFHLAMMDASPPLDLTFWIPSMVSPDQFANGSGGQTGPGGGGGGGGGANPGPGINVPTPGAGGTGGAKPGIRPAPGGN
jgi:prepilin-type N-terminal cleavage/methylation domain-containing protein